MSLIPALLSLYILLKPFYLWSSGLPQISDFVLLAAFIITIFTTSKKNILAVVKNNRSFFIFLVLVAIINLLYSINYADGDFNLHTAYYLFDALGIVTFSIYLEKEPESQEKLKKPFKISLIMQLAIFLLHIGRYYGSTRYMGTFNDPNQFAYYCLLSYGYIFLLGLKDKKITDLIYLIVAIVLIFASASTGMLIGMGVFLILHLIPAFNSLLLKIKHNPVPILISCALIAVVGSIFVSATDNQSINNLVNNPIVGRVQEKLSRAKGNSDITLWQERGYDRIYYYPLYVLYGAGEGAFWRFDQAFHQGEFHATLPSILFCYGIIPLTLIVYWLYKKLQGQHFEALCVYIAILAESFTLINSRQVLFWTFFILSSYLMKAKGQNEKNR